MKRYLCIIVLVCLCSGATAAAGEQSLRDGIAGVPWSAAKDDFRRAIPSLKCAPIACRGPWRFHRIDGEIEVIWGGFSPVITSSTFKFSSRSLPEMKRLLRSELGAPKRQYSEDGEAVAEWRFRGVLIDLYHGSERDSPQIYIEPNKKR